MATRTYKVLGQADSVAATPVDLYTVPGATQAVISSLVFANSNSSDKLVRVWIRVAGASAITKQLIAYDVTVRAKDILALQLGLTLGAADVVTIQVDATGVSVNAFGYQYA